MSLLGARLRRLLEGPIRLFAARTLARERRISLEYIRRLSQAPTKEEACRVAVEFLQEETRFKNPDVFLPSPDGARLIRVAAAGRHASVGFDLAVERGIVGRAFRTRSVQRVRDVRRDPDYVDGGLGGFAELSVPIRSRGRVLGVLDVESPAPVTYTAEDARLFLHLGALLGEALIRIDERADLGRALREEEERTRELAEASLLLRALLDVVLDMGTAATTEALFRILPARLALVGYENVYLIARPEREAPLDLASFVGEPPDEAALGRIRTGEGGLLGRVLRERRPVLVPDTRREAGYVPVDARREDRVRCELRVPVLGEGDFPWGVLVVNRSEPGSLGERDLEVLSVIAAHLAARLERQETVARLSRELDRARLLHDSTARIAEARDVEEMARIVVEEIGRMGYGAAGVFAVEGPEGEPVLWEEPPEPEEEGREGRAAPDLPRLPAELPPEGFRPFGDDPTRGGEEADRPRRTDRLRLRFLAFLGVPPERLPEMTEDLRRRGGGLVTRSARSRRPRVWNDLPPDRAERLGFVDLVPVRTRHQIDVPIRRQDRYYGVLSVESADRPFDASEERVFRILADHLAVLWANRDLMRRIERSAMQDPLTGLWNRRYLQARLREEEARMVRTGEPLALVLIDLTDFKEVNDRYGHLVGDMVLKELARILRETVRACDVVSRFGGDEFVLLMPRADVSAAEEVMRRFEALASSLEVPGCPRRVRFDFGISAHPEDGRDFAVLLRVADERMYDQKLRKKGSGGEGSLRDTGDLRFRRH